MILQYARRQVITAHPDDRVSDVVGLMDYYNVGCVVITERHRPVGIVTDRDLALRFLSEAWTDPDPGRARISEVMSREPQTIHDNESFDRALEIMSSMGLRRLPVVDRDGRLQGIVSLDDLLEEICLDMRKIAGLIKQQQRVLPAPVRERVEERY